MRMRWGLRLAVASGLMMLVPSGPLAGAQEGVTADEVLRSIDRGKQYLASQQHRDGSWTAEGDDRWKVGVTSLALLALLNAGAPLDDPAVRKGLEYLRSLRVEEQPEFVYEISLMVMALAAAKDGQRDLPRMMTLTRRLEQGQNTDGNIGMWSYRTERDGVGAFDFGGDNSNTQYALLALKEASDAGVPVDPAVWERAQQHWRTTQNLDGGWGYSKSHNPNSSGSMTVAGISSLIICNAALQDDGEVTPDGRPICCNAEEPDPQIEKGLKWLEGHFAVSTNPPGLNNWVLYYLYGLERAGRLSGRRFFGTLEQEDGQGGRVTVDIDWYREGADILLQTQTGRGFWRGSGSGENDPVVGTSFALLFLSKGLAPVLINKLHYGPPVRANARNIVNQDWNQHPDDVRNLTDFVSGLEKWPKLVTWQTLELNRVVAHGSVQDLRQAPVLYLSGQDRPRFTPEQAGLLREYIDLGGFIFAVRNCNSVEFEEGLEDLIEQMFPNEGVGLKELNADHIVYRSHFPLDADKVRLKGVDLGCRTALIYSPEDISCYWDRWTRHPLPGRHPALAAGIDQSMKVGVNVVAYATGREPPIKLRIDDIPSDGLEDRVQRGLLEIAKIKHGGQWDTAPNALKNLLIALNRTGGLMASTKVRELAAKDDNLFKYPIVYMHGRGQFALGDEERGQLRTYLENGGVLFADACCGDRNFDAAFREMIAELFPGQALERIPIDHELMTGMDGYAADIRKVRRRMPESDAPGVPLELKAQEVEPYLEGITLGDRYAVIYSKYDISCALERQSSVACAGYLPEDAVKIGVNIVMYAMLQDVEYKEHGPDSE